MGPSQGTIGATEGAQAETLNNWELNYYAYNNSSLDATWLGDGPRLLKAQYD